MSRRGFIGGGLLSILTSSVQSIFASAKLDISHSDDIAEIKTRVQNLENLIKTVRNSLNQDVPPNVPLGTIIAYAGLIDATHPLPEGWLLCNGNTYQRTGKYEPLFKIIGTAWGKGNGLSTFNLPDLQGQFLRGVDGGAGADPQANSRTAVKPGGNTGDNVGSVQQAATAMPTSAFTTDFVDDHNHNDGSYNLLLTHNGKVTTSGYSDDISGGYQPNLDRPGYIKPAGKHSHSITAGGDVETRPKNAYVYWIIKASF